MSALVLPSVVTAVTVFRRGAVVTRTATLSRGEGFPEQVRLEGLPLLLEDESLQVQLRATGEGGAPVAGDVRVTLAVPEPDEQLRPPSDEQLDAAKLELSRAQQHGADLGLCRDRMGTMVPGARGAPEEGAAPMTSPTDARLSVLALRRDRLDRLRPQLSEAKERIRVAAERLQTLEERERRASQARNPRTFEARKAVVVGLLPVTEHPADQLELSLRYFVPGARWAPSYVLRLDPSLGRGVLEYRALVGQATGENWSDVALTLSTANPQQWTELPELKSLRIGRRQPPVAKTGWRPPPTGTDLLYADYDRLPAPPPPAPSPVGSARAAAAPPPPPPPRRPPGPPADEYRTQSGVVSNQELERMQAIAEAAAESDLALPAQPVMAQPMAPPAAASPVARRAPAKAKKRGGGPPPPGMAPSMPPQGAPMRTRSGGVDALGAFGAAGGGGPPGTALLADEGGGWPQDAPAEAPVLTADRTLLEYGSLWLPPADNPERGALRRADQARRYGQLASLPAEQIAAALSRIGRVRAEAIALEQRVPPGGHRWSTAVEGFDYAYPAQARVDLESDGELHGLALRSPDVQTRPRYICVPRETPDVFRVVVIRNPLDAPLLPGPVDVYVGGRFALASTMEQTPPGGRVELGLGVEQAIKVARNVGYDDEASGLLKRHQKLEHRVRITVRNNLAQTAAVELRERLPVLRENEDDIELTVGRVEPEWDELKQEDPPLRGGRVWTVEVPAKGERNLEASWSIKIPQSQELVGGNRREG